MGSPASQVCEQSSVTLTYAHPEAQIVFGGSDTFLFLQPECMGILKHYELMIYAKEFTIIMWSTLSSAHLKSMGKKHCAHVLCATFTSSLFVRSWLKIHVSIACMKQEINGKKWISD